MLMAAAGCTTTGVGFGHVAGNPNNPATFRWKSNDSVSGRLSATLPDGRSYSGPYFQITRQTDREVARVQQ
jgi:hypothetical protein